MRKMIIAIGAVASAVVLMLIFSPLFIPAALMIGTFGFGGNQGQTCGTPSVVVASPQLNPTQERNAGIIIASVAQLSQKAKLSVGDAVKAEVISVATSYGEANLINIGYGDTAGPDSRGLFQQRAPWGPLAVRMDPAQATKLFFRSLLHVSGWQQMTVTQAAHAVQRNADPNYYAQFQQLATKLVGAANRGIVIPAMLSASCPPATSPFGTSPGGTLPGRLILPVNKSGASISSCYGPRFLNGKSEFHPGLDIAQAHSAPVYAAASGVVTIAGPMSGYGNNFVSIISENRSFELQYGHMMAMSVTAGQKVTQGQQIGQVGNEGESFGDHLHLNYIRIDLPHNPYNGNVDPLKNGLSIPAGINNPNGCT